MRNGLIETLADLNGLTEAYRAVIVPFANSITPNTVWIEHYSITGPVGQKYLGCSTKVSYTIPVAGHYQSNIDQHGTVLASTKKVTVIDGTIYAADSGITSKPYNNHRLFTTLNEAADYIRWFFKLSCGSAYQPPPSSTTGPTPTNKQPPTLDNSDLQKDEDPVKAYERAMKSLR